MSEQVEFEFPDEKEAKAAEAEKEVSNEEKLRLLTIPLRKTGVASRRNHPRKSQKKSLKAIRIK